LPGLLANAAATVDHISGGRVELGLGGGWMEREHRAYGLPFPETSTRLAMFAEQLEIIHRLWTEPRVDFHGAHYTLEDAPAQPKPLQQPHPPLLVGGSGTRGTADPAARFADEYNTPFASPDDFARIRANVRRACEATGRTLRFSTMTTCLIGETRDDAMERARRLYGRIPRQASFDEWLDAYRKRSVIGSVDEVAEQVRRYEGCDRVMCQHLLHDDLETVELIGRLGQQLV
jgi:alkanesulfonate monooxygenase SsuD/methylene tetrahydromethanopterin reductase-like flavin-dependent oxidoreductase (luciferase family)